MILDQISNQESNRWFLYQAFNDKLVYRTNFTSDPYAAIEFVIRRDNIQKVNVLFKSEGNKEGMGMYIQKEISVDRYLAIADSMSEMFYEFII